MADRRSPTISLALLFDVEVVEDERTSAVCDVSLLDGAKERETQLCAARLFVWSTLKCMYSRIKNYSILYLGTLVW